MNAPFPKLRMMRIPTNAIAATQAKVEPPNKTARGLAEFFGIPALMDTPAEQAAVAKRLRRRRRNIATRL